MQMTILLIEIEQRIVQAMTVHQSALFQLPFMTDQIFKHFNTKKRSVNTVKELVVLQEEDRRGLLKSLSEQEYKVITSVSNHFPALNVEKAYYSGILMYFNSLTR